MPFPEVVKRDSKSMENFRYVKGLVDEIDHGGETVIGPCDDMGDPVGLSPDLRIKATLGVGVALFKQAKRDDRLPSGWVRLSEAAYLAEFQALKGRAPSSVEM